MAHAQTCPPVDVIVPFYKNVQLVRPLFESLHAVAAELKDGSCCIVAVNDSPDDAQLREALRGAVERLAQLAPCRLVENESNMGFVRSVNAAVTASVSSRHDVILLNSDTVVFPGAFSEIRRVAYLDPMTGFVSPRSNNATICSLPHQPEFRHLGPEAAYANFRELSKYLPEYHYVPTAVGFCLYIKLEILEEFGLFSEVYGRGYNEENDLIMRANRCGYRAVLANHAFVYHVGEVSFSASSSPKEVLEEENAELLSKRYPEYQTSVANYFAGTHYEAECMLAALLPDSQGRLDLVFDFSSFGPYHNGTFEAAKRILRCGSESWPKFFNLYVMASEEAARFHELDRFPRVHVVPPETARTFAIAFRFGQPFEYQQLTRMSRLGVLNVYGMLDPIAFDCQYLNHESLAPIWGTVFEHGNGVIYISDFVGEQFRRRFRIGPWVRELVAYLSMDLRDYARPEDFEVSSGDYILVIGNAFEHKRVPATVDAINQAFPLEKIVALGFPADDRQNVIGYSSGQLNEATMRNLLRNAKVVIYPSLYEGFGIPVMESLAFCKPVLARSIPVMRDIRERIHAEDNLLLYNSTTELIDILKAGFPEWKIEVGRRIGAESSSWEAVTRQIGEFLRGLPSTWSFRDSLVPRLEHIRLLTEHGKRVAGKLAADEIGAGAMTHLKSGSGEGQALQAVLSANEKLREEGRASQAALNSALLNVCEQLREQGQASQAALNAYEQLRNRDAQIIYNSLSWQITAPLRFVGGLFLRLFGR